MWIRTRTLAGPFGKGSPIGVLGRVAQQQPLFPWFSIAATHRGRLQTGRHEWHCTIHAKRLLLLAAKLLREIHLPELCSELPTRLMYYLVTIWIPRLCPDVLTSLLTRRNVAAQSSG